MSQDLQSLIQRTQAGEPGAMTALGKKLLFGDGVAPAPQKGIALINEAASLSDGEAAAFVARLAAWGVLQPRDMTRAFDFLARSAALGFAAAQTELRFLARDSGDDWRALRRRIDLSAWLSSPPPGPR